MGEQEKPSAPTPTPTPTLAAKPKEKQAPMSMGEMEVGGVRTELSLLPNCKNFEEVFQLCNWIASSNIVPSAYRDRPADVFVAAEYGSDLGLRFMTSIQNIAIIGGKPALPSDIKLAMVRSRNLLEWKREASIEEIKKTGIAWCEMKRVGDPEIQRHTFSEADAKTAGLWERRGQNGAPTPWVLYPFRMLQLKPRDMCLRDLFGDVFKGMNSVEEAQEIQLIETSQGAQALIAEKSQPETKGKAILEAERVPLKQPEPASVAAPVLFTTQAEPDAGNQAAVQDAKTPEVDPIFLMVNKLAERLRALPAGGAALLKIWSAFKLPVSEFGKKSIVDLLPSEQIALFGMEVEKVIAVIEAKEQAKK